MTTTSSAPLSTDSTSLLNSTSDIVVMAIVSSENRTCAPEELLELYRSPRYISSVTVNIMTPLISLFFLMDAIRQLCSQSIIQYSTRVLLIVTILFAVCHQVAYFCFKTDLLYTMFYKLCQPCYLQHSSYDCRYITIATTTGNCGLALTQLAMSIDRMLALQFPRSYFKLKSIPGFVLGVIVFIISFSMWFILTIDDPLTGFVNHCGFYPSYSTEKFHNLLDATFYIAMFNFVLDVGLMYYAKQEIIWKNSNSYELENRFESKISFKCTQAVFVISICQCISNLLYSGLTSLLMFIGKYMTSADYTLALSIVYTTPYACLVLPILICKVLKYIKEQRAIGIQSLSKEKQDGEDHHAKMRLAWGSSKTHSSLMN